MKGYFNNLPLDDLLDRRSFLKWLGIIGVGVLTPVGFSVALSEEKFDKRLYKTQQTEALMGTFVTITVLDSSRARAEEAVARGFAEVQRLIGIFSRYDSATAVGELNARGGIKGVPQEMTAIMKESFGYYRLTNGWFDITVKPLVDLFKKTFKATGNPPAASEIKDALSLVGMDNISCNDREIRFLKAGMGITLDGIAKGYIVDRVAMLMKKLNVSYALINAGGDIRALGEKKWRIAIRDPFDPDKYVEVINLKDNAIATSGNYEVYFDKEKLYHHIITPGTGYSPAEVVSASVVTKTTVAADALSTAILALGPVSGKQLIGKLPDTEALMITRDDVVLRSYGWGYST